MRNDQKVYKNEQFCVENGEFPLFCKAKPIFQLGMSLPKACLYGAKKVYLG